MTNEITLRYAEALFSLKKESSSLDESLKEVKELQKIIKDNLIKQYFETSFYLLNRFLYKYYNTP